MGFRISSWTKLHPSFMINHKTVFPSFAQSQPAACVVVTAEDRCVLGGGQLEPNSGEKLCIFKVKGSLGRVSKGEAFKDLFILFATSRQEAKRRPKDQKGIEI